VGWLPSFAALSGLVRAAARVYLCTFVPCKDLNMPSFDVVSDYDAHEARNGVDQANREVTTRFDFKGTGSKFELEDGIISLTTQSDFQLKQMMDILQQKLSKRGVDIACLEEQEPEFSGSEARQKVIMRRGIDTDRARKLVKQIKVAKMKVQAAIQGDKLRISGKKRDDLQAVIAMLRETDIGLPLQYENFRD
jgi:cyclic-di-GMP-binding protein